MVLDTRGHEIPSSAANYAAIAAFQALSRSISSVQTAADIPSAQTLVDAMVLDGLTVDGTAWWVSGEDRLFIYRTATGFTRVLEEQEDTGEQVGSFASGFVNYAGDADNAPRWRRFGPIVEIRGVASPANGTMADNIEGFAEQPLFTLPAGYRPGGVDRTELMQGSGRSQWLLRIDVDDGVVSASRYSGEEADTSSWLTFATTFFAAEE